MNSVFFKYCLLFSVFLSSFLFAQRVEETYEKEKIYAQTDHVFYKPGDVVYFKAYVVNGSNNLTTDKSKVLKAHLIEPSGTVVEKLNYRIENGSAKGSFSLNSDIKGGIYKIKFFTNWMQNESGKNSFEKEINVQKIVSPRILMKLDFPKKGYGSGDEVFADFSMRSLANVPVPFYEGVYSVFVEGKEIISDTFITDREGKSQIKFKLPENLKSSDGLLNIKLAYDGFPESISRNIPIVLNTVDLRFFPEGGTFVNGVRTNLAFKAMDEFEKPVDVKGDIFNQNHLKVAEFGSFHFGMGELKFTPKSGEKYYAKLIEPYGNQQIFELPTASENGLVMNIVNSGSAVEIKINSTQSKEISLKAGVHGKEYYSEKVSLQKGENSVLIQNNLFPAGIARFTVSELQGIPLAERVVFLNDNKLLSVNLKFLKKMYLPREKVEVKVETRDHKGNPVSSDLSLSVVDDKLYTYADDKQDHLISWLLMSSELSGKVFEPSFYFKKDEPKSVKTRDLLMLTNGYRYFSLLPEIEKSNLFKYPVEQLNGIYGVVTDEQKKPVKSEVFLVETGYQNNDDNAVLKQETTEDGRFYFSNLDSSKTNKIIARSKTPKQKVKIKILSYKLDVNPLSQKSDSRNIDVEELVNEAVSELKEKEIKQEKKEIKRNGYSSRSDTTKTHAIEEVVVLSYDIRRKASIFSSTEVNSRAMDVNPDFTSMVAGKVSGVTVVPAAGNSNTVIMRGAASLTGKTPLYVVDGVPVESFSSEIDVNNINSVTILKDAAATAIYGSRAANGVVIINSRNGRSSKLKLDLTQKTYYDLETVPGIHLTKFSYVRNFKYPVYSTTSTPYRFDFRETVYWNPYIQTDKNGRATVEFYNSDATTTFRAISEGISSEGLIGRDEKTYAAQSRISADAKIPPYLTMGDRPKIPVVVKNNVDERKMLRINPVLPKDIKLLEHDSLMVLKPLQSGRILLPIETGKTINSNLSVAVISDNERETLILPLKVEEKGFPKNFSVISSKDTLLAFTVPETIPYTLSAKLKLYGDLQSRMFDDIERLTAEPYGCFEQLSATVYPNVFILDYLKNSKKLDKGTETKAIRKLKNGYQKLATYQLQDGGFGYFHSSESQIGLSAFALNEFNALGKFVQVNPKIKEKVLQYLLKQRTGKGTFIVKYKVADKYSQERFWAEQAYALFALAKYGLKTEISKEYEVSLSRALQTGDAYQSALLANTAFLLDRKDDYHRLMKQLNQNFNSTSLKSATSFVGSRGNSLSAETLSLYLLAMLKADKASLNVQTKVVDELAVLSSYYGYGSTQGTVLALEALSEFHSKTESDGTPQKFVINGHEVDVKEKNQDIDLTDYLEHENKFSVSSKSGHGLPYKIEWKYYVNNPPVNEDTEVKINTALSKNSVKVNDLNRMKVEIKNQLPYVLPMVTAKIGIPAGLSLQPSLLKDLVEKKQVSYYEIFDNFLVLYWESMQEMEVKTINLDLKAEFPGDFTGKSSAVYLYYTPENKNWAEGLKVQVKD